MERQLLFICSRNRLRSPTAEAIFRERPGISTDSAGLAKDADVPLEREQLEWADIIFVMEPIHRRRLNQRFGKALSGKKVVVLGIPDQFPFMDPQLIQLLQKKCARYLT